MNRGVSGCLATIDTWLKSPSAVGWLGAALALAQLGLMAAKLPIVGRLELFLTADYGGNLTLDNLLQRGYRPSVDVFNPYGLLPAVAGRAWFGLAGDSPQAYLAVVALLHVAAGWGLARAIVATRSGWVGALLTLVALPYTLAPTYANLSHGLEAVMLIAAIGSQARGRLGEALALTAVALFAKPSMAYVYGFGLTMAVLWSGRGDWRRLVRGLGPAFGVVVVLSGGLGWLFGLGPLIESLVPTRMAAIYRAVNFGFFHGVGRRFWDPPGATVWHYLGTSRGYWIAATAVVLGTAMVVVAGWLWKRREGGGLLVSLAGLHAAFVCLFFGSDAFWIHYAYVLTIGMAALAGWSRRGRGVVLAMAMVALVTARTLPREYVEAWRPVGVATRSLGLWATPEGDRNWRETVEAVRGESPRAVFLAIFSNAGVFEAAFEPPVDFFFVRGMETSVNARQRAQQISRTDTVVVPGPAIMDADARAFLVGGSPEIRVALAAFEEAGGNAHYRILRRVRP